MAKSYKETVAEYKQKQQKLDVIHSDPRIKKTYIFCEIFNIFNALWSLAWLMFFATQIKGVYSGSAQLDLAGIIVQLLINSNYYWLYILAIIVFAIIKLVEKRLSKKLKLFEDVELEKLKLEKKEKTNNETEEEKQDEQPKKKVYFPVIKTFKAIYTIGIFALLGYMLYVVYGVIL